MSTKPAPAVFSLHYVSFSTAQLAVLLQGAKASNCTIAQLVTVATCAHLAASKGYDAPTWERHTTNGLQIYARDGAAPETSFARWEQLKTVPVAIAKRQPKERAR